MFGSGLIRGESAAPGKAPQEIFSDVPRIEQAKDADTDSAWVAQLVERVLGKDEVTGSIPVPGSRILGVRRVERKKRKFGIERG